MDRSRDAAALHDAMLHWEHDDSSARSLGRVHDAVVVLVDGLKINGTPIVDVIIQIKTIAVSAGANSTPHALMRLGPWSRVETLEDIAVRWGIKRFYRE